MNTSNSIHAPADRYLVRSRSGLVLTERGEFVHESLLGPGGYSAKLYKTERGARSVGTDCKIQRCNRFGITTGEAY